jgi:hypothetical protein
MKVISSRMWSTFLLLLIVAIIVSIPILQAGFFSDDIFYSTADGAMRLAHQTLWQYTWQDAKGGSVSEGRLLFASLFNDPIFYYFQSPLGYQIVRVVFIWLSVLSGAWFIQLTCKNTKISMLFIALFPLFWSISEMSNALVSYAIMLQVLVILILLGLCCFMKYLEKKNLLWCSGALVAYILALTIYEPAVILFFAIGIIAWDARASVKQFMLQMLPFLLISFAYLVIYYRLRSHGGGYDGTAIGALNGHAIMTFIYQLTAAIPLSVGLFHAHWLNAKILAPFFYSPLYCTIIVVLFFAAWVLFYRLIKTCVLTQKQKHLLGGLALPFCIIPSILIAISIKYQVWVRLGYGYVPLYVQYVGMTFLFIVLCSKIKRLHALMAGLLSAILCLSFMFNLTSVQSLSDRFKYPRALEQKAIQAGLLKGLPVNASLMTSDNWSNVRYWMQVAGIRPHLIPLGPMERLPPMSIPMKQQRLGSYIPIKSVFFIWSNHLAGTSDGRVMLGQVQHLNYRNEQGTSILSEIVLTRAVVFSSEAGQQTLTYPREPQHVAVSWVCLPHHDVPCLSLKDAAQNGSENHDVKAKK